MVEFNGIDDTEDVTEVVDALNLAEYIHDKSLLYLF